LKTDRVHSSLLPVTHLPDAVFSAPCAFRERQEDDVKKRLRYPEGDYSPLIRFILRDGKLFTFHNLNDPKGPFIDVIDRRQVQMRPSKELWEEAEGHRRFIALLNSALYKYTARLGVRFDPLHRRFYFPADEAGKPNNVVYHP